MKTILQMAGMALWGLVISATHAATLCEDFSTDPVSSGRFDAVTAGTQSAFNYGATNRYLTALLDVDHDVAYYLSQPFPPADDLSDISFSFRFRVVALDITEPPTVFVGLVTTNHVANNGDGLTVAVSTVNGVPVVSATVDQGSINLGGDPVPLAMMTDYLALGRYTASNRLFN